jgi:anti-sigma factor RsiW
MRILPWESNKAESKLSAYLDGELDDQEAAELGERLVFDVEFKEKKEAYKRLFELVDLATSPASLPDSTAFADHLVKNLGGPSPKAQAAPLPSRSKLKPALLASVGILLTAGLAFAGLRRRGLV